MTTPEAIVEVAKVIGFVGIVWAIAWAIVRSEKQE